MESISQTSEELDGYRTPHRADLQKCPHRGWMVIPVLEFLNGLPLCPMVLNLVEALQPSCVRITPGEQTCDAVSWRVTIFEKDGKVQKIEQMVEVGLRDCDGPSTEIEKWLQEQGVNLLDRKSV